MDLQTAFNVAIGLAGALMGFVLKAVWDGLRDLKEADTRLAEKVQNIEVLVAGKYVTWDGLREIIDPFSAKLDKIMDKLDHKVDHSECERFHGK